jgi:poly(U)-specific endoribonuclease
VDFKGFNYDNKFNRIAPAGASVPHVATIAFSFTPLDMDGQPMGTKRKNLGGFFVGPSPELQIAMPVAAYFESTKGLFFIGSGTTQREKTEKRVEIHDAIYRLVLYRETRRDQSQGNRLRSFFPKFIGLSSSGGIRPGTEDVVGDLAVTAMLANPVNPEEGREWIEIENRTDRIMHLEGWSMRDHRDRPERLPVLIEPRERLKVPVTRSSPNSMQLTNSGGTVSIFDNRGQLVSRVTYPASSDGQVLFFGGP